MNTFFSIIVPTLNEERFIPKLLKDLTKQKKRNFELIIVDGKSKDKTREIIQSFINKLPLQLITIDKPHLPLQKNLGATHAKSKYLIFLDADMSVLPSFTSIAERYVRSKKGLVYIPYIFPEEKKEYQDVQVIFILLNRLVELSLNFSKPFSGGASMIWERNLFDTLGGFDDIFGEDHQIIRKSQLWGVRPRFIKSLKVRFSLRRMKKEGRLKLFSGFIMSHIYLMFNDKFKTEFFTYEMGGQLYNKMGLKKKKAYFDPQKLSDRIKNFFKTILSEE